MRSHYVELDDGKFHYLESLNRTGSPLLFLHGILRPTADYQTVLRQLAVSRWVIALDQRGHGRSERADEYTWEALARDAAAFVSRLELPTVDVVGYSMGAYVAMMLAAAHPALIRSVVAIEGGLTPPDPTGGASFWPKVFGVFTPEGYGSPEHFVNLASETFPRLKESVLREAASRLIQRDDLRWDWPDHPDPGVMSLAAQGPTNYKETIGLVKCPVLVLRAEYSELFPGDGYQTLLTSMDRVEVGVIPRSGHLLAWENPNATSASIARFLGGLGRRIEGDVMSEQIIETATEHGKAWNDREVETILGMHAADSVVEVHGIALGRDRAGQESH